MDKRKREHEFEQRKKARNDEKVKVSPMKIIEHNQDLILQHLTWTNMSYLTLVSRQCATIINNNPIAMRKVGFKFNPDSSEDFEKSSRKYQNIKVTHDEVRQQKENFLEPLLGERLASLKSLTFQGTFDKECIEYFFTDLKKENARSRFHVKNITLIGDVTNAESLLSVFKELAELVDAEYESIMLIEMSAKKFSEIFNLFPTKTLVLKNSDLRGMDDTYFCRQDQIKRLELSMTKINERSFEQLMTFLVGLEDFKINDIESQDDGVIDLVEKDLVVKVQIDARPISMDPFTHLHEDVHDSILQHLKCFELKIFSNVSKTWDMFSEKTICKNVLYNSQEVAKRVGYGNIETEIGDDSSRERFTTLNGRIKELTLEVNSDYNEIELSFPSALNLNHLTLLNITCHVALQLDNLTLPTTIKILHLTNFKLIAVDPTTTSFHKSLINATNLEDMSFKDISGIENMFITDLSTKFPAKLKGLSLPVGFCVQTEIARNIHSFLMKQLESLTELIVDDIHFDTLRRIVTSSCKLESLEFGEVKGSFADLMGANSMNMHSMVNNLKILKSNQFVELKPVLKLFPRLIKIKLHSLRLREFSFCRTNYRELKEIHYKQCSREALQAARDDRDLAIQVLEWLN